MKKIIVIAGIVIALIALMLVGLRFYTKQFSPADVVLYEEEDAKIEVHYSRPYKKGREIFGGLVPYGETWRTGANEATIFKTNKDIMINGKKLLPAGSYSLFTVPNTDTWGVIFNSETGQWGIDPFSGQANREKENDVLQITVNALKTPDVFKQFTISFEKMGEEVEMILMWDQTLIVVPITIPG